MVRFASKLILSVGSGLAWSLVKQFTFLHALGVCLIMVLRDYLLVSLLTASILWSAFSELTQLSMSNAAIRLCTNALLSSRGTDSKMEWAYAFDLQCNGFFALFSWLYVLQLFLLPLITATKWISILAGNTLYFVA